MFTAPHTLLDGATVTLQAWGYRDFSARYADYVNLITALAERVNTPGADSREQLLLNRVLAHAIPDEQDQELVTLADMPDLLEGIFVLNRVEELAAKALGLHLRRVQAITTAQEVAAERFPEAAARIREMLASAN